MSKGRMKRSSTCHRPYGTPSQHERACVRCPMLRLDLAQVPRLLQIEDNTRERLAEAKRTQCSVNAEHGNGC